MVSPREVASKLNGALQGAASGAKNHERVGCAVRPTGRSMPSSRDTPSPYRSGHATSRKAEVVMVARVDRGEDRRPPIDRW